MEVPGCCGEVSDALLPSWESIISRFWMAPGRLLGLLVEQRLTSSYRLEERRKVKGTAYYERKKAARRQLTEAQKSAKVDDKTKTQLAEYGY